MKLHLPVRLFRAVVSLCSLAVGIASSCYVSSAVVPDGYKEVIIVMEEELTDLDHTEGNRAFLVKSDLLFDGLTSPLMGEEAESWYLSGSSNISMSFTNATDRVFDVAATKRLEFETFDEILFEANENEVAEGVAIYLGSSSTLKLTGNKNVLFSGSHASCNYGGSICGESSSSVMLNDNGSVKFFANSSWYGGAIYGDTISLNDNYLVEFSENLVSTWNYAKGGAVCCNTITLNGNDRVNFSSNSATSGIDDSYPVYGGAIYGSEVTLSNNRYVEFHNNSAFCNFSGIRFLCCGGAIYGSTVTLSGNESVTFSGNTASDYGGAIYGSTIMLSDNTSVTFSGNSAGSRGGAIYGSMITLNGNETVTFSGNTASSSGGAIYGDDYSTITLSDNRNVEFRENSGGAISGGTVTLSDNVNVEFSGNCGTAIYGSTVTLSGNESVTFSGNSIGGNGTVTLSDNVNVEFSGNYGTAIYGASGSTITLSDNGNVEFCGNNVSAISGDDYITITLSRNTSVMFGESSSSTIYGKYGSTITLSRNGSVTFCGNTASGNGGAIRGGSHSTITLSDNGNVEFRGYTTSTNGWGGAISVANFSTLTLIGNESVEFSGNMASDGGAIRESACSTITLSGNGSVTFCENKASFDGGAIRGGNESAITLSGNGSVTFSGNTASFDGGAIYGDGTISLSDNESVEFSGNMASDGGAIYGGVNSTITLSGNEGVTFSGNTASSSGGAIYGRTITLSGNGSVKFSGNNASDGSAIYAYGNLSIRNNDSVLFEKNGNTYRLRSIYAGGSGDVISLSAAEGGNIEFRDSVYIASSYTVELNADYTDADGVVHKQTGDIIFTGAYTEQHLNELLADAEAGRTATADEILNSRTTKVYAMTNLYGGCLRVEDGAIYRGYGITVHEGSAATVLVKDATLSHAGYNLAFNDGTTLELKGENTLYGDVQMLKGSHLSVSLGQNNVDYVLGSLQLGGDVSLSLSDSLSGENAVLMYVGGVVEGWDEDNITIHSTTTGLENLTWVDNTLVLNYNADTFNRYFNGEYSASARLIGDVCMLRYAEIAFECISVGNVGAIYGGENSTITLIENESVKFSGNTTSSSGGAIYGGENSTITLSENESVKFSGNTASSSGGAIYGGENGTITLSENESVKFSGNTASSSGGAIYGGENSTITLNDNGSVTFNENSARNGGAIYGRMITLRDNESVTFSGNTDSEKGGAIYGRTITLRDNGSVTFSGNTASVNGGAIYGDNSSTITLSGNGSVTFSGNTASSPGGAIFGRTITLGGNGNVEFSGNTASGDGGAIYGRSGSTITLSDNGRVTFSGNTASSSSSSGAWGGAIYGYDSSTITLSGNGSVTFSGNSASSYSSNAYGGAIRGDGTISLSDNVSVTFIGNTVSASSGDTYGGAIFGRTITLNGNEGVTFSGNMASDGGAICAYGNLSIRNNDSVLFEKNGNTYRLRSIDAGGSGNVISLSAAAGGSIEFRDSVYIASGSMVLLNDAAGLVHRQTGDIIFTGKYTEQHLNELLAEAGEERMATTEEILNSRTTEVNSMTNLYGGRLRVEDGAVYKGCGITAYEGSAATIRVKDAVLEHAGYDITLCSGSALELEGVNTISASQLVMRSGSTLQFLLGEENKGASVISLAGDFVSEGGVTYTLKEYELGTEYQLISMSGNQSGWDTDALSFVGKDGAALNASLFCWDAGTLYFTTEYRIDTETDFHGFDAFPITGSGTYRVSGVSGIMAADRIALGNSWTGTIVLENCTSSGMELDYYANESSRLVIDGLSGWFGGHSSRNMYVNALLELEDGGLRVTDSSRWTYHFNGGISGVGDFVVATQSTHTPSFVFRGDLSGWDGAFRVQHSTANSNIPAIGLELTDGGVLFSGTEGSGVYLERLGTLNVSIGNADAATTMRGAIINAGVESEGTRVYGELNLTVNHDTTFDGSVDVTKLTLAAGAAAEFNASLTAGSVAMNANSVLTLTGVQETEPTIGVLSGSGVLTVTGGSEKQEVRIASISSYAGAFSVSGANSTLALNLAADDVLDASRVTLESDAALVLGGCGTYDLGTAKSLASGVSLGDGWSGTVRLNGAVMSGDSLAGLSNPDSFVELRGVSGYLNRADSEAGVTYTQNLVLSDVGEAAALSITDGYQKDKRIFAGSVSGSGTFARATSKCGTLTYIFAGDVSGWDGAFSHAPEKDNGTAGLACTLVTFNGSREINAAVKTNGKGVLNVALDDENLVAGEKVTVNSTITADRLEVTEGTTVSLKNSASVDTLRAAGVVELASGARIEHGEMALVSREEADMALFFDIESTEESILGLSEESALRHVSISGGAEYLMQNLELENVSYTAEQSALTLRQVEFTGNCMFSVGATGTILLDEATLLLSVGSLEESADGVLELDYSDLFHCTASGELEITMDKDVDSLLSAGYNSITLNLGDDVNYDNLNLTLKGATYTGNSQGVAQFALLAVPEPTSATLSMLALAALAARRRRK